VKRCALTQCEERAEQPFFIEKKKNIQQIQNRLNLLMQEN
jgi:hypothetical protein